MKRTIPAAALLLCLCLAACHYEPTYYRITDPGTGKVYYTDGRSAGRLHNGAVTFHDASSGARVTLQNSEIKHISQSEYLASIGPPPPTR